MTHFRAAYRRLMLRLGRPAGRVTGVTEHAEPGGWTYREYDFEFRWWATNEDCRAWIVWFRNGVRAGHRAAGERVRRERVRYFDF